MKLTSLFFFREIEPLKVIFSKLYEIITTNEAGTKLMANITQIACNKLTPISRLKS